MRPTGAVRGRLTGMAALALTFGVVLLVLWGGVPSVPLYRYEPVAWSDSQVGDGGRTLAVTIMHGACDAGGKLEAELRDDVVEIRAYIKDHLISSGACTTEGRWLRLEVRLREPLGDRAAYDPTTGHREAPATGG